MTDPSGEIAHALDVYRGYSYKDINNRLRGGHVLGHQDPITWIRNIDRALDASPLRDDVMVYRSLHTGQSIFGRDPTRWGDLAGFEWREPGYVSTSVSRAKAANFEGGGVRVMLRIVAAKGYNGITLSDLTYEGEILLDRDLIFRVVVDHGDDRKGVRQLDVEIVSRKSPRTPI